MDNDSNGYPSCQVNHNAQNPNGQRDTMAGTAGIHVPPNADMHSTVNKMIDPTSTMGAKNPSSR